MGGCRVDGPTGEFVQSAEEMVSRFYGELFQAVPAWRDRLTKDPGGLADLEREVHAKFSRGADMLVVGLVSIVMKDPGFEEACERTRREFTSPLHAGRMRDLRVRMLGGLVMWVSSLYCAPCRSRSPRPDEKVPGLHVELVQFGFGKGCTPGLESKVARQTALCPSLEFARQELERDGVRLDGKTVRRMSRQSGEGLLWMRTRDVMLWRDGKLAAGSELAGNRVSVQLDGGRSRIRGDLREISATEKGPSDDGQTVANVAGRSRKRPRKTFDADWREPKLLTIFVHDEQGRMVKKSRATIDGTFLGPDALAELVAMHLHRLGAAQALSITFAADGGVWIWERIPTIVRRAKLEGVPIHEVLDCCHAAHHISLALAALGLGDQERRPLYREHRTLLRNGQWRRVVEELTELAAGQPPDAQVWTEIAYLQKHGAAGRLMYPTFRGLGIPLGSGAIESSIRRVINLRLKGNSIFWREENAEAMLQIRAQVLTNRWDDRLVALRQLKSREGCQPWRWTPQDMRSQTEHVPQSSA